VVATQASIDLHQGDGQAALTRVQALLAQGPDDAGALELEGDVEAQLKQTAAAAAAYSKAQQLRPSARVAANLYRVRLMGHTPRPQQPLEQWLAREPQSWPIRDLLGQYYLGAGKSPRLAMQQFKAAIAAEPTDVVALNNLAWALNETGDPGAEAFAERAHDLAPNDPSIDDTLGWILARGGKAAGAIDYLRQAVKLDPRDANVQYHLAYALAKTGQAAEARQILGKILSDGQPFDSRPEARQLLTSVKS
jgi:predicted Zn-dependent protease